MVKRFYAIPITPADFGAHLDKFKTHEEYETSIFYLSNPSISRRAKYEKRGMGGKPLWNYFNTLSGFPVTGNATTGRFLVYVENVEPDGSAQYLASCVVMKSEPLAGVPNPIYFELWSVISNPNYLRSGAVKYMILGIMNEVVRAEPALANRCKLILSVSVEEFPFISFYDRLFLYGKLGFHILLPGLNLQLYTRTHGAVTVPSESIEFYSKYHRNFPVAPQFTDMAILDKSNNFVGNEQAFRQDVLLMKSTSNPLPFATDFLHNYNFDIIGRELADLENRPANQISRDLPQQQYGYVGHSGYRTKVIGGERYVETQRVPPNVEVVIINTLGFSTYTNIIKHTWNSTVNYFSKFSIEQLQQLYPPFKSGANGINVTNYVEYYKNTAGGILLNYTNAPYTDTNTFIKIHAYKANDKCPVSILEQHGIGTSAHKDWSATSFGIYKIADTTGMMMDVDARVPTWDNQRSHFKLDDMPIRVQLDPNGIYTTFAGQQTGNNYMQRILSYGTPNQEYLVFPTTPAEFATVVNAVNTTGSYNETTAEYVDRFHVPGDGITRRFYIFSCGDFMLEPGHEQFVDFQQTIQRTFREMPQSLVVTANGDANAKRIIKRMGELMFDIFDKAAPAAISPASVRSALMMARNSARRRGAPTPDFVPGPVDEPMAERMNTNEPMAPADARIRSKRVSSKPRFTKRKSSKRKSTKPRSTRRGSKGLKAKAVG